MTRFTEAQWKRLRSLLDEQEARVQRQLSALGASVVPMPREAPFENADLADEEAGTKRTTSCLCVTEGSLSN